MKTRHSNLDTLRLLAAFSVLFAHCFVLASPGTGDPISNAAKDFFPLQRGISGQGVALFFVISGYLVTASFINRRALSAYFSARILRIMPALWVLLLVTLLVGSLISALPIGAFLTEKTTAGYMIHNGSLIGMRYELAGVFTENPVSSINLSLWTLPLEFVMYLVIGALGALSIARSRVAFSLFVIGCFTWYVLAGNRLPVIQNHHDSELILFFLAGAWMYVNREWISFRWYIALPLIPIVMALSYQDKTLLDTPIILATSYTILWLGLSESIRLPNLAAHGDLSYATYLYAAFVSQLWLAWLGVISPWLLVALTAATTLPIAFLSWRFVEQPALSLKPRVSAAVAGMARPALMRRRIVAADVRAGQRALRGGPEAADPRTGYRTVTSTSAESEAAQ